MAFFGMLLVSAFLMIIGLMIASMIVGLLLLKKHKIIAVISLVLSGVILVCLLLCAIFTKIPRSRVVQINNEKVVIKPLIVAKYDKCIEILNIKKLNKLLDKHQELIYCGPYGVNKGLLDYGLVALDIEIMQCAMNHGAVFDDINFSRKNSLQHFFEDITVSYYMNSIKDGMTTDKIINAVRFALERGARVEDDNWNFYETAEKWVQKDGVISPKDEELLNLIKKYF